MAGAANHACFGTTTELVRYWPFCQFASSYRLCAGLAALLDDEVVFHSPVVHTPQVGKAVTTMYLTAAL